MTIEDLLDEAQIRRTMTEFNIAGDRGQVDKMAALFTEDGHMIFSGREATGRAGIRAMLSSINHKSEPSSDQPPVTKLRHHVTTSLIDIEGDVAKGRSYFIIFTNNGPYHMGTYVDAFRRVEGHWLIARREVRVDWHGSSSGDRFDG
jgi:ketosteroid isomerase-like protein